jgi:DNA-binding response OmpR family regulator
MRRQVICLVDDNPYVRDALAYVLRDNAFDVRLGADADAGLRLGTGDGVDIVVTDINLLDSDGLAMIAALRASRPGLFIVAMTGEESRGGVPLTQLASQAGADLCLMKPFRPSVLLEALSRLAAPA